MKCEQCGREYVNKHTCPAGQCEFCNHFYKNLRVHQKTKTCIARQEGREVVNRERPTRSGTCNYCQQYLNQVKIPKMRKHLHLQPDEPFELDEVDHHIQRGCQRCIKFKKQKQQLTKKHKNLQAHQLSKTCLKKQASIQHHQLRGEQKERRQRGEEIKEEEYIPMNISKIKFNCGDCHKNFDSEVKLKRHIKKLDERQKERALQQSYLDAGLGNKNYDVKDDPELKAYLFDNGPRPTNIRGDPRALAYKYFGKKSKKNITQIKQTLDPRLRRLA